MARKNSAVKNRNKAVQVVKTRNFVIRVDRKGNVTSVSQRQY